MLTGSSDMSPLCKDQWRIQGMEWVEAILQPTPIPVPAFNTADRYASSLAKGECLVAELDSILPDHIKRVRPSNHFQDVVRRLKHVQF